MSESMIIGVDHGYAAMKTAHFSFPSGLVAYEHEPYTLKDVLEYGGKFYVVGSRNCWTPFARPSGRNCGECSSPKKKRRIASEPGM